jgi:hypothetical protein
MRFNFRFNWRDIAIRCRHTDACTSKFLVVEDGVVSRNAVINAQGHRKRFLRHVRYLCFHFRLQVVFDRRNIHEQHQPRVRACRPACDGHGRLQPQDMSLLIALIDNRYLSLSLIFVKLFRPMYRVQRWC